MWVRLTHGEQGLGTKPQDQPGPQQLVSNLNKFLGSKGGDLARELYTPEQIAAITNLRDTLAQIKVDPRVVNSSGTGYTLNSLVGGALKEAAKDKLLTTVALIYGGMTGDIFTAAAIRASKPLFTHGIPAAKSYIKTKQAMSTVPAKRTPGPLAVPLLGAGQNPLTSAGGQKTTKLQERLEAIGH
jgi:hypothetical protein